MIPKPSRDSSRVRSSGHAGILILVTAVIAIASAASAGHAARVIPLKLPAGIVYDKTSGPDSAVVFRHTTHVNYENGRCTNCHPKLYRILNPTRLAKHSEMNGGGSCGVCHDGTHAFDVRAKASCGACHVGRKSEAILDAESEAMRNSESFRGPDPYTYPAGRTSPGPVVFKHTTHTGPSMKCATCHSRLFEMKARPPREDEWMHGKGKCGGCHDGKDSFGVEDQKACGRCHAEGKAAP